MDFNTSSQLTTRVDKTANARRDVDQVPDPDQTALDLLRLADSYRRVMELRAFVVNPMHHDHVARHAARLAQAEASFSRHYLHCADTNRDGLVEFLAEHPEIRVTDSVE